MSSPVRKEGEPFRRRPRPGQIIPISKLGGFGRFCFVAGGGGIFASDRSRLNLDFNNSPSPGDGRTSEPKNSGLEGLRIIARGWRGAAFYILLERSMDCLQRSTRSSRPSLIFTSLFTIFIFSSFYESVFVSQKHLLRVVVGKENKERSSREEGKVYRYTTPDLPGGAYDIYLRGRFFQEPW